MSLQLVHRTFEYVNGRAAVGLPVQVVARGTSTPVLQTHTTDDAAAISFYIESGQYDFLIAGYRFPFDVQPYLIADELEMIPFSITVGAENTTAESTWGDGCFVHHIGSFSPEFDHEMLIPGNGLTDDTLDSFWESEIYVWETSITDLNDPGLSTANWIGSSYSGDTPIFVEEGKTYQMFYVSWDPAVSAVHNPIDMTLAKSIVENNGINDKSVPGHEMIIKNVDGKARLSPVPVTNKVTNSLSSVVGGRQNIIKSGSGNVAYGHDTGIIDSSASVVFGKSCSVDGTSGAVNVGYANHTKYEAGYQNGRSFSFGFLNSGRHGNALLLGEGHTSDAEGETALGGAAGRGSLHLVPFSAVSTSGAGSKQMNLRDALGVQTRHYPILAMFNGVIATLFEFEAVVNVQTMTPAGHDGQGWIGMLRLRGCAIGHADVPYGGPGTSRIVGTPVLDKIGDANAITNATLTASIDAATRTLRITIQNSVTTTAHGHLKIMKNMRSS